MSGEGGMFSTMKGFFSKSRGDAYKPIAGEDEESGRIRLGNTPEYDDFVQGTGDRQGLLSEDKEGEEEQEIVIHRKGMSVCTFCGLRISCFAFWLIFCIAMGLLLVVSALSYAKWTSVHSSEEDTVALDAPVFGKELGCIDDPSIHGSIKRFYTVPIGKEKHDHFLNVRGGAVGTVTILPGSDEPNSDDHTVSVELLLHSSDKNLLDTVVIEQQDPEKTSNSFWRLSTPYMPTEVGRVTAQNCMRYDVTLRIPPSLKKLHVAAHATAHMRFGDDTNSTTPSLVKSNATTGAIDVPQPLRTLEDMFITFFSPWGNNLFLPSTTLAADRMNVEMTGGYLVGSVAVRERAKVLTQRGGARAHVDIVTLPYEGTADLRTVTGYGRTELSVFNPAKRNLAVDHLSTGNGDLVLHYERSFFQGPVEVHAKAFQGHSLQGTGKGVPGSVHEDMSWSTPENADADETEEKREMWVIDKDGKDTMKVSSRQGWVGLFFL